MSKQWIKSIIGSSWQFCADCKGCPPEGAPIYHHNSLDIELCAECYAGRNAKERIKFVRNWRSEFKY